MKRYASLLLLALSMVSLAPVASATPVTFVANLLGSNEVPANNSPGIGSALVTVDITTNVMEVFVVFSGLIGTTTASHIHCCAPAGSAAGVATTVPTFPGFPLGVTAGTYDHVFDLLDLGTYNPAFVAMHGGTAAGAEAALYAGMLTGQTYLNIHTTFKPGGEIRGQLVPEPGTLALVGCGLLLLIGTVRRPLRP